MIPHLLIFLLLGLVLFHPAAQALDWPSYRDRFLEKNPKLLQARQNFEMAQAEYLENSSLYSTYLRVQPSQSKSLYDFGAAERSQTSTDLGASLEQKIGYGASIDLSYRKDLNPANIGVARVDQEYSLGLSQALWKNAFGTADRALAKAAHLQLQRAKLELQEVQNIACQSGLELYSQAYVDQNNLAYFNELKEEAARAHGITNRSYRRRLVKKIDWLAAENDRISTQADYIAHLTEFETSWIKLQKFAASPGEAPVPLEPLEIIENSTLISLPVADQLSYEAQSAGLLTEANELRYEAAKIMDRSDLDLKLEVGAKEGAMAFESSIQDFKESFIRASVAWAIPLFDPKPSAQVGQSYADFLASTEAFRGVKLENSADQRRLLTTLNGLNERLDLHSKKAQSLEAQLAEAKALLRAGRIEYQDYLGYRSQWFRELKEGLDLKQQIWLSQLAFLILNRQESLMCGGLQ